MADLITVVIPVYNAKEYLERAVVSMLTQSYTELELLLIDDGSTDGSGELCDALAIRDQRIRVVHKENTGVSDTRNMGISMATGKYLTFIDSDDYVEQNYVERMYEELCHTQSQVAVCFMKKVFDDGRCEILPVCREKKEVCIYSGEDALQYISDTEYPVVGFCCATLYDVSVLRKNNLFFDTTIKLCEDMLFKCQLYLKDVQIVVIHEALYVYCIRNTSATGSALRNTDRLLSEIKARKEIVRIAERWPNTPCEQRVRLRLFTTYVQLLKSVAITGKYQHSVPSWVQEMRAVYRSMNRGSVSRTNKLLYTLFVIHPGMGLRILRLLMRQHK